MACKMSWNWFWRSFQKRGNLDLTLLIQIASLLMKHSCCQSKEIEEVYREITGAPSENIILNVGIERDLFYNLQSHKAKTERS